MKGIQQKYLHEEYSCTSQPQIPRLPSKFKLLWQCFLNCLLNKILKYIKVAYKSPNSFMESSMSF